MDGADVINDQNRFESEKGVIPTLSPLSIDKIDDSRLLQYLKGLEKAADQHWNKKGADGINLKERRKQNLKYLFGKQLIGKDLKAYESEFLDNVIGESEKTLKALAVSKMPDILVTPGGVGNDENRKLTAELLTKTMQKDIDSDQNKRDLGTLFKHMPVYFIAVKKYRWDASKNGTGEIVEEVINPEHVVVDHTALTSNPDEMQYIIHYVEKTAKEWVMLFPTKENEIKEHVAKAHPALGDSEDILLAQKVRVAEVWFDWFDKAEDFDEESNPKFDFMSGVAWMLSDNVLLGKSKNPNWDYEGHDVALLNGQPVTPDVMEQMVQQQMMMGGTQPAGLEYKKVYNNYFKFPKKPFIFMTFDQFMRSAIDETSRIEQQIPLQKSMDDVERQTDHIVKNLKGKHIWGSESGIDKKALKQIDMENPNIDLLVKGNPHDVHEYIQPEMPPAEMFVHIRDRRDRMFAKVGAHGAVRGEVTTDVATTNQISREADFTVNDDLVNSTILFVVSESLKARLHMMKLRYTEEHFKRLAGTEEGKYLHLRLTNDSIDDGMEVEITASTTDKLRAERNAQSMASLKMIEPYYYFKDMGIPDPEGRAEALYLFNSNPAMWFEKIVKGKNVEALAQQVTQSVTQSLPQQNTMQPGMQEAIEGETAQPSPTDTSNIPVTPQGGQGMLGKMGSAIRGVFMQPAQ